MGDVSTIVSLFIVIGAFTVIRDLDVGFGSCPRPKSKDGFSLEKYLGTWYEYQRIDNWSVLGVSKCVYAQYTDKGNGEISIRNGGIDSKTKKAQIIDGTARVIDTSKPAEMSLSSTSSPSSSIDNSSIPNYVVSDTDYDTYAVVFSCFKVPILPLNFQTVWILTRKRGVAPRNMDALTSRLKSEGVRIDRLKVIDQADCESTLTSSSATS